MSVTTMRAVDHLPSGETTPPSVWGHGTSRRAAIRPVPLEVL
jgi:hypothetical protein